MAEVLCTWESAPECNGPCAEQQSSWACSIVPTRTCSGSRPGPGSLLLPSLLPPLPLSR